MTPPAPAGLDAPDRDAPDRDVPDRDAPDRDTPVPLREVAAERGLAGLGYGLVVAALFTVWITGVVAWIMAFQHRNSPDPVARAHFRFQLWVADLAGVAVGIAAAGAVSALILVGGPIWEGDWPSLADFGGAAGLVVLGALLWAAAFGGTIAAAAFGAWRLLQGRTVRGRLLPGGRRKTA